MKSGASKPVRCAIYTRVSTDHGLEQDFNSLDAQHDAAQAYIRSQAHAGWTLIRARYDDGGYSGGSTDRPALQRLLSDVKAGKIDVIVVYKVDRLTRSLADFAKLVELFDGHDVSFVSVTQQSGGSNGDPQSVHHLLEFRLCGPFVNIHFAVLVMQRDEPPCDYWQPDPQFNASANRSDAGSIRSALRRSW